MFCRFSYVESRWINALCGIHVSIRPNLLLVLHACEQMQLPYFASTIFYIHDMEPLLSSRKFPPLRVLISINVILQQEAQRFVPLWNKMGREQLYAVESIR